MYFFLSFFLSCLNFCAEAWWFLSLRVFGLLTPSLLLFHQRFGRYVHLPSSGVMANRIRGGDPRGFNKGRSSKFREGSRVRQTPEEGRRTYRPKRWGNNYKEEDNKPKTLNDKEIISFCYSLFYFSFSFLLIFFKLFFLPFPFFFHLI